MDAKKLNQIERQRESRGYKRYTNNLVGNEDYAYMKTTRNSDGELKYIISHGFYDFGEMKSVCWKITVIVLPSCFGIQMSG